MLTGNPLENLHGVKKICPTYYLLMGIEIAMETASDLPLLRPVAKGTI